MKRTKVRESQRPFLDHIRRLEEQTFADQLSTESGSFMKREGRAFWHFRPSHHIATGLLTQEDIALLSEPGKRLLSVGAHPAFLEQLLPQLGVPAENILVADKDPAIAACIALRTVTFDATQPWPEIGTFDRIIFPECLCTVLGDRMRSMGVVKEKDTKVHPTDAQEAQLLAELLIQALRRLRSGGVIRANGPMSHPNVMKAAVAKLEEEGLSVECESRRFFLAVRADMTQSEESDR